MKKRRKPMVVVNFLAQPGAGKSTSAAATFARLKNKGCNVELINEFAKQLVYAKRQHEMGNQVYMLAKQYKKMKDIDDYEHVPLILTDSPILLGLLYSQHLPYYKELKKLAFKLHEGFKNVNVLVRRVKPYNPSGRNQTEKESDALVGKIKKLGIKFDYIIDGDKKGQKAFAKVIYKKFKKRIKIKN